MPFYVSYGKLNDIHIREYLVEVWDDKDSWASCSYIPSHPFCESGSDISDKTTRCKYLDHYDLTVQDQEDDALNKHMFLEG